MFDYCCDCDDVSPVEGYCKVCVLRHIETFRSDLENFLADYKDIELVAKGPNLIIRHKTGEEIYL